MATPWSTAIFNRTGAATAFGDVESAHAQIVDQVVEIDDALMELYLDQGEELEPEQLHEPFEKALREGHLVPICFVSAKTGAGVPELLEVFERLMPNPMEGNPPTFLQGADEKLQEVRITTDPADHVIAHVVMLNIDRYKGRLAVFRIHQGTIRPGMQLYVGAARTPVKATQLLKLNGNELIRAEVGVPGDICAIPRVDEAHYDAVLHNSHDEDHIHLKAVQLPAPTYGLAIRPANDADVQKVSDALRTLQAEDPSLRLEHITALNEIVLRGTGSCICEQCWRTSQNAMVFASRRCCRRSLTGKRLPCRRKAIIDTRSRAVAPANLAKYFCAWSHCHRVRA